MYSLPEILVIRRFRILSVLTGSQINISSQFRKFCYFVIFMNHINLQSSKKTDNLGKAMILTHRKLMELIILSLAI